jgi:hypothetical protein
MELNEFAENYKVKVKKLEGESVIPGRKVKRNDVSYPAPNPRYPLDCLLGHLFEYSSSRMGLVFMPRRPMVWKNISRRLGAAGFEIRQNGDWEGIATFDPTNPAQARLAIKVIGARRKRQASKAHLKSLARLRTLITWSKPSIKPPLATVESFGTSGGIGGVGGIVKSLTPSIKPPLAALGSIGMEEHGAAQAQA